MLFLCQQIIVQFLHSHYSAGSESSFVYPLLMSNTPPRGIPNKTARVAATAALFNAVISPFLSPFVRGKIRRADTDMQEIRRLLDEYQAMMPTHDQETILVNFNE